MKTMVFVVLAILAAVVVGFSAYYLPDTIKVKVSGVETRPIGRGGALRYVYTTVYGSGEAKAFLNLNAEFWPPYFKFNSPTVQAKAQDFARRDNVALVTYYGWYMPVFGLYPNLVDLDAVNPHYTPGYSILNIIYWVVLAVVVLIVFVIIGRLLRE